MKVIKKITKTQCYCCNNGLFGIKIARKKCKSCNGKGRYEEAQYFHIITTKDGQQYCFDGETLK
jgi:hypothetical protein